MKRFRMRWRALLAIGLGFGAMSVDARAQLVEKDDHLGSGVPSLAEVLRLVRGRSPEVLLGNAGVAVAKSSMVGARLPGIGNPYVEVLGRRSLPGVPTPVALDATAWLPLEIFGQRATRIAEAEALVAFERQNLEVTTAFVAGAAVSAYGQAAVGKSRLGVLAELLEVAGSEAESYQARYGAGDVTLRDARLAELELARYSVFVEETKADVAMALSELSRLTGVDYASPPTRPRPPSISELSIDRAPTLALSRAEAAFYDRSKERSHREGASGSLSLMLNGGRNDLGDAVVGAGLAYAFPVVRRNQGEQAHAEAAKQRALLEERVKRRTLDVRVRGLSGELAQVKRALEILGDKAEPAAVAAVNAAVEMQRAGKSDLFPVLTSRRELGLLKLRRLDLVAREWAITSELVAITGRVQ
jgi:outer membrane protein, heavy metal efflux system